MQGRVAELRAGVVLAELLGPDLAGCCETVELRGTTLSVTTSNPAFAHQLRLDSETIMTRLNQRLVGRRVRVLRVRTGRGPGATPHR